MNIFFLTAATGGGHVKAAQALMEHMEKQLPGCKTRLVDALKYINPSIDRLITGTYLNTVKALPGLYGKFYDLSEKDETITRLVRGLNNLLSHRLLQLFQDEMPDAVICTHTMPLQMMARLKKKGLVGIPVIGIVTDYTNHYFWKLDEIDAFIVAHECIKDDMVKMGLRENRIHVCGIPVAERFAKEQTDRRICLARLGLENKPTVLVMGGSLGLGNIGQVFRTLLYIKQDIQIVVVTGSNKKLRQQLDAISADYENIRVLGYAENISELMSAANLIITKPGGITISEALVKRLPICIIDPIPGQEERNAKFLRDSGAAFRLTDRDDLEYLLEHTLLRPNVLKRMSEAAGRLAKPNACEEISDLVERLVQNRTEDYCISQLSNSR
ncbi:MAG TPA: glycosyltransferase [Clostridia bacterium]|nr:glycosyltransferase [Clostridia bacterium]